MIDRNYGAVLRRLLRQFPCVTVLGPRQCGKTTFIRAALPDWTYLDLERPSDRARKGFQMDRKIWWAAGDSNSGPAD